MDHAKRVYGYLSKMKEAIIWVHTDEPDYSALPNQEFDCWEKSVYHNVSEILPAADAPRPPGNKYVTLP
jgi:hypothetical protein